MHSDTLGWVTGIEAVTHMLHSFAYSIYFLQVPPFSLIVHSFFLPFVHPMLLPPPVSSNNFLLRFFRWAHENLISSLFHRICFHIHFGRIALVTHPSFKTTTFWNGHKMSLSLSLVFSTLRWANVESEWFFLNEKNSDSSCRCPQEVAFVWWPIYSFVFSFSLCK